MVWVLFLWQGRKRLTILSVSECHNDHKGSGGEALPLDGKAQSHQAPLGQDPMSHQQDGECLGQGEEDQCHGWLGNSHDLNLIENLRAIMKARLKRTPNRASMPLFERAIKLILVKVLPIS
jgi:hypothetical protein